LVTAALLGVGGYFLGNALSKFVEPASVWIKQTKDWLRYW
jgi:hypothetical protein